MADLKLSRASVMRHVTMTVRFTDVRTWPIRLWLGTQLIRLAARCIGCGIKIHTQRDNNADRFLKE